MIPYNWQSEPRRFETPTEAACKAFNERLVKEHGYFVKLRETRGADKIMYAGYFPMGLSLERIFEELPDVPFKDEVWPKFLRDNAVRVFGL